MCVVERNDQGKYRMTSCYHLSPRELSEIHKKYGRPGVSPGRPATESATVSMKHRPPWIGITITPFDEENEFEPDLVRFENHTSLNFKLKGDFRCRRGRSC